MKTNPAARRRTAVALALSVLVALALGACASDPVRPGQTVQTQTQAQPHAYTPAQASRRASSRDMFAVAYRADGIVITSSSPPTVETLPSGMFRVTFTHP